MSVKISYLRLCVKGAAVSAPSSVYFYNLVQAVFKPHSLSIRDQVMTLFHYIFRTISSS